MNRSAAKFCGPESPFDGSPNPEASTRWFGLMYHVTLAAQLSFVRLRSCLPSAAAGNGSVGPSGGRLNATDGSSSACTVPLSLLSTGL